MRSSWRSLHSTWGAGRPSNKSNGLEKRSVWTGPLKAVRMMEGREAEGRYFYKCQILGKNAWDKCQGHKMMISQ